MKIEIDNTKLINDIVEKVVEELKPLLSDNITTEDNLFTVITLALHLHVSEQWVYDRVSLNEIPYMKMGKFLRFRKSEIDKWLDKMKTPAIQPLSNKLKVVR
jgi:excisionase family DNA binding protein